MQGSLFPSAPSKRSGRKPSLLEKAEQREAGQLACARLIVADRARYKGFLLRWAENYLQRHGAS